MLKVASLVLDIYDDSHAEIARSLPRELHACKVADAEEVEHLTDKQFGLVMKTAHGQMRRRFPLHNEDSLKLSEAYFSRVRGGLPDEITKIVEQKIAEAHAGNFESVAYVEVEQVRPKLASFSERCWGLTVNGRDHYPLHDETLVKTAAERFPFTTDRMAPEHKFLYARNIEKRASQLGVEIDHTSPIHRYTSDEVNLQALSIAIEQRKMATANRDDINGLVLDQLSQAAGCQLEQGSAESHDSFALRNVKLASIRKINAPHIISVLEQFDKTAGISRFEYNRGMLDPFAACYKLAAHVGGPLLVDGVDLGKVDPAMLESKFDADFIKEFSQDPVQVYKSLPDPVRSLIRGMAEDQMAQGSSRTIRQPEESETTASGDPTARLNPGFADGATTRSYA